MELVTTQANCPSCQHPVEIVVSVPLISNTELGAMILQAHTDELRCPECGLRVMIVMSGAMVNSQWQLLPRKEEGLIAEPGAFRVRKEN